VPFTIVANAIRKVNRILAAADAKERFCRVMYGRFLAGSEGTCISTKDALVLSLTAIEWDGHL